MSKLIVVLGATGKQVREKTKIPSISSRLFTCARVVALLIASSKIPNIKSGEYHVTLHLNLAKHS